MIQAAGGDLRLLYTQKQLALNVCDQWTFNWYLPIGFALEIHIGIVLGYISTVGYEIYDYFLPCLSIQKNKVAC